MHFCKIFTWLKMHLVNRRWGAPPESATGQSQSDDGLEPGSDPRLLEVVVDDGGGVHASHGAQWVDELGHCRRGLVVVQVSVSRLPQIEDVLGRTRSAREVRHVSMQCTTPQHKS